MYDTLGIRELHGKLTKTASEVNIRDQQAEIAKVTLLGLQGEFDTPSRKTVARASTSTLAESGHRVIPSASKTLPLQSTGLGYASWASLSPPTAKVSPGIHGHRRRRPERHIAGRAGRSARSKASGIGAAIPNDEVNFNEGINVNGLELYIN